MSRHLLRVFSGKHFRTLTPERVSGLMHLDIIGCSDVLPGDVEIRFPQVKTLAIQGCNAEFPSTWLNPYFFPNLKTVFLNTPVRLDVYHRLSIQKPVVFLSKERNREKDIPKNYERLVVMPQKHVVERMLYCYDTVETIGTREECEY